MAKNYSKTLAQIEWDCALRLGLSSIIRNISYALRGFTTR